MTLLKTRPPAETAATEITYENTAYPCGDGETVLEALLKAKVDIPYSCEKGTCLTCLLKAEDGPVPKEAQRNLKPTLTEQGYFLACQCRPTAPLKIAPAADAVIYGRATVKRVDKVAPTVCRVTLRPSTPLYYRAGQFINIRRADGLVRSYSLASVPRLDSDLEIHVKRMPRGQMSNWIYDEINPGDELDLQGPNGDFFYVPGQAGQTMLLIGTGTGLAPLLGVARDALEAGHTGEIHLYHGSREADGLYMAADVGAIAKTYVNFHYVPCVSGPDVPGGCREGRADIAAFADHSNLKGYRVFACGYPAMVEAAKKQAFLSGAILPDILADAFDFKDLRDEPRPDSEDKPDVW
ncbi:MAG: 2Fe-2S iron-sulfur cluster binding domain-containing protein [Rhodospirillales bacterium]|nr:2Fe-2S iron-sulfur cluster binding domain-containing protein [Rhodospirillales bacterium]